MAETTSLGATLNRDRLSYKQFLELYGIKDPDNPLHYYNYKSAWMGGGKPDEEGKWPSKYKTDLHPNRYMEKDGGLIDTKTNKKATIEDKEKWDRKRGEFENKAKIRGYKLQDFTQSIRGEQFTPNLPYEDTQNIYVEPNDSTYKDFSFSFTGNTAGFDYETDTSAGENTLTQFNAYVARPASKEMAQLGHDHEIIKDKDIIESYANFYNQNKLEMSLEEKKALWKKIEALESQGVVAFDPQMNFTLPSTEEYRQYIIERENEELSLKYQKDFFDVIKDYTTDPRKLLPFVHDVVDGYQIYGLWDLTKKVERINESLEKGEDPEEELTEEEKEVLMELIYGDSTTGGKIADTVFNMIPFMGEMAATLGIGQLFYKGSVQIVKKISKDLTKNLATKEGKDKLAKAVNQAFSKKLIKQQSIKTVGEKVIPRAIAIEGLTRTKAVVAPKISKKIAGAKDDVYDRMIPTMGRIKNEYGEEYYGAMEAGLSQDDAKESALWDNRIEVISEYSGGLLRSAFKGILSPFKKLAKKYGPNGESVLANNALFKAFTKKSKGKIPKNKQAEFYKKVLERGGWNGYWEEIGEERFGGILRAVADEMGIKGLDTTIWPDKEQWLVELVSFGVLPAGMTAQEFSYQRRLYNKVKDSNAWKEINRASEAGEIKGDAEELLRYFVLKDPKKFDESNILDIKDSILELSREYFENQGLDFDDLLKKEGKRIDLDKVFAEGKTEYVSIDDKVKVLISLFQSEKGGVTPEAVVEEFYGSYFKNNLWDPKTKTFRNTSSGKIFKEYYEASGDTRSPQEFFEQLGVEHFVNNKLYGETSIDKILRIAARSLSNIYNKIKGTKPKVDPKILKMWDEAGMGKKWSPIHATAPPEDKKEDVEEPQEEPPVEVLQVEPEKDESYRIEEPKKGRTKGEFKYAKDQKHPPGKPELEQDGYVWNYSPYFKAWQKSNDPNAPQPKKTKKDDESYRLVEKAEGDGEAPSKEEVENEINVDTVDNLSDAEIEDINIVTLEPPAPPKAKKKEKQKDVELPSENIVADVKLKKPISKKIFNDWKLGLDSNYKDWKPTITKVTPLHYKVNYSVPITADGYALPSKTVNVNNFKRYDINEKVTYDKLPEPNKDEVKSRIRTRSLQKTKGAKPKNKKQVFKNKKGKQITVGNKTPEDWLSDVKANLTQSKIKKAREWYGEIYGIFKNAFGEQDGVKYMVTWLLSQKQKSPSQGLRNALQVAEEIKSNSKIKFRSGPKKGQPKIAGLSDRIMRDVFEGKEVPSGMGAKLLDFVDSALETITRRYMGNSMQGGHPAVVDRHTYRDRGYLTPVLSNKLLSEFDVKTKADVPGENPSEAQYEEASHFFNEVANYLNEQGYNGGGWTPAQVQAVGWTSITNALGEEGETAQDAIVYNTSDVLFESIFFGEGSPYAEKYKQIEDFGYTQLHHISNKVSQFLSDAILDITGAKGFLIQGSGGYLDYPQAPSTSLRMISTPETMQDAMDVVGYVAQQTEVMTFKPIQNGDGLGVQIYGKGLDNSSIVDDIYRMLREYNPDMVTGYTAGEVELEDGGSVPSMVVVLNTGKPKNITTVDAKNKFFDKFITTNQQLLKDLLENHIKIKGIDIKLDYSYIRLNSIASKNNWKENNNGESYIQRLSERFGSDIQTRLDNVIRKEFEQRLEQGIQEAQRNEIDLDTSYRIVDSSEVKGFYSNSISSVNQNKHKYPNGIKSRSLRNVLLQMGANKEELDWMDIDGLVSKYKPEEKVHIEDLLLWMKQNRIVIKERILGPGAQMRVGPIDDVLLEEGVHGEARWGDHIYKPHGRHTYRTTKEYRELLFILEGDGEFTPNSIHYDTPNLLGHVRFGTRFTKDGKKVLFIDEMQSDWHQQGSSKGYGKKAESANAGEIETLENTRSRLKNNIVRMLTEAVEKHDIDGQWGKDARAVFAGDIPTNELIHMVGLFEERAQSSETNLTSLWVQVIGSRINDGNILPRPRLHPSTLPARGAPGQGDWVEGDGWSQELEDHVLDLGNTIREIAEFRTKQATIIPEAPYKKTAWIKFFMKRLIRWAVDNNHDYISWTPSAVQYQRWQNRFDHKAWKVRWVKQATGPNVTPRVTVTTFIRDDGQRNPEPYGGLVIPLYGQTVIGSRKVSLNSYLGKEMADEIRNSWDKTPISDEFVSPLESEGELDFNIGGRHFQFIYDQAIPSIKKYIKKWNSNITKIPMITAVTGGKQLAEYDIGENISIETALEEDLLWSEDFDAIPITDEMVNSVLEGQPSFRVTEAEKDKLEVPEETSRAYLQRKLQDSMNRLNLIQDVIGDISEEDDVYLKAELFIGSAAEKIDRFRDSIVGDDTAFVNRMDKDNISVEDFGDLLYALHAKERNSKIIENNPDFEGDGSGMSNADANKIIKKYKKKHPIWKYEKEFRESIIQGRLDVLYEGGLINEDQYNLFSSGQLYSNYVPLKGKKGKVSRPMVGKGWSVGGKDIRRAWGRGSRADNPFIQSLIDMEEALIRVEKNKVTTSLYNLAQNNPWDGWEAKGRKYKPQYNQDGEIEYFRPDLLQDNQVSAIIDGKHKIITINDEALLRGIKKMGTGRSFKFLQTFANYFRAVNTMYNPKFILTNFFRDLQTAGIHLFGEQEAELSAQVIKDIVPAMQGVLKEVRDGKGNAWSDAYADFKATGGRVGWFDTKSTEEKLEELNSRLAAVKENAFWKRGRLFLKLIRDMNEAVEMGVRLSAYVNMVNSGISKRRSAQFAKNLTVNFNKKGEWGSIINSIWIFSNAGIQGSTRILSSIATSRRTRAIVGGVAGMAFLQSYINRIMCPDVWERTSSFEKDNNWVIVTPNCQKYTIRVPYGYNMFKVMGQTAEELMVGDLPLGEALARNLEGINNAFNPIQSGTLSHLPWPTFSRPLIQYKDNVNFMGTSIYRDDYPFQASVVNQKKAWPSMEGGWEQKVTNWFFKLTGGDLEKETKKPWTIDTNPELLEHLVDSYGGGTVRFLSNTLSTTTELAINGRFPETRKIPIVNAFKKGDNGFQAKKTYSIILKDSRKYVYDDVQQERFYRNLEWAYEFEVINAKQFNDAMLAFEKNQQKARGIYDKVKAYKKHMKKGMKMPSRFYSPSKPPKKDEDEKDNKKNNTGNSRKGRRIKF